MWVVCEKNIALWERWVANYLLCVCLEDDEDMCNSLFAEVDHNMWKYGQNQSCEVSCAQSFFFMVVH